MRCAKSVRYMKCAVRAVLCAAAMLGLLGVSGVMAAPQEFTYQAQLADSAGTPIDSSNVNVTLRIYDALTGGNLLKTQSFTGLDLTGKGGYVNLVVTPPLPDLTKDLYVEVTVQNVADAGPVETLAPRQKITSTPFALSANTGFPNRTLIVNPSGAVSASPTGSASDPFNDLAQAYAKAKTMAPGYHNRVVVMMMPGRHIINTPVVLDTQGIDIIGFGEKSAVLTGSADPILSGSATGGTGVSIRNLIMQGDAGTTNRLVTMRSGRIQNVNLNRAPGSTPGTLLEVDCTGADNVSVKDFELYGDVNVISYGGSTSFSNGFITGTVTSTGNSAALSNMLSFVSLAGIGAINFQPTLGGVIVISYCVNIGSLTTNPTTLIMAGQSGFFNPMTGMPQPIGTGRPATNSVAANCVGNVTGWTTPSVSSPGNVPPYYVAFIQQ